MGSLRSDALKKTNIYKIQLNLQHFHQMHHCRKMTFTAQGGITILIFDTVALISYK